MAIEQTPEAMLQSVAAALEVVFNQGKTGKDRMTGFCLLVFGFNAPGISNYVSNAKREDMIKALRETVERLEAGEDNVRFGDEVLPDD